MCENLIFFTNHLIVNCLRYGGNLLINIPSKREDGTQISFHYIMQAIFIRLYTIVNIKEGAFRLQSCFDCSLNELTINDGRINHLHVKNNLLWSKTVWNPWDRKCEFTNSICCQCLPLLRWMWNTLVVSLEVKHEIWLEIVTLISAQASCLGSSMFHNWPAESNFFSPPLRIEMFSTLVRRCWNHLLSDFFRFGNNI